MNLGTRKEVAYTLVPEKEANLKEGKLATTTPIAAALLGHKKGDVVEVSVPAGQLRFEILDISI
jgi:transcription elongation factor GreA